MEDKTRGTVDEVKGKGQEAWGDLTGDEEAKTKGQYKQAKGNVEQGVGNVKSAVKDITVDDTDPNNP